MATMSESSIISCPCGANYADSQTACPRCKGKHGKIQNQACEPKIEQFMATEGKESDLQEEVEAWLREHHWYFFHDRSKKANSPGFLDLVIATPRGITLWVELKKKGEYPTKEQKETIQRLSALGHYVKVVRSFDEFAIWAMHCFQGGSWDEVTSKS